MSSLDEILAVILGGGRGSRLISADKNALQTGCSNGWKIQVD